MAEKILDVFAEKDKYDIALITTFNFDISFFERSILNRLYENNVKKVSLFVDSYELNRALSEINYSSIGKKYIVNPIEMKEAFHPKVILLLGQTCAKLVVSSANITISGYLKNNEIFNVFEYDDKHPENLTVITSAISFFEQLNNRSFNHDKSLFEEIKNLIYYGKTSKNEELQLIHNLNEPILSQVAEIINDVIVIDIAVPYYDNSATALKSIYSSFPNAKINLYLQQKKCKFPLAHKNTDFINYICGFNECGESNTFYHGKVFRFTTQNAVYYLYGSANCTQSALCKSANDNGNIECCVLEKGLPGDFEDFFNNFNIIHDSENLECHLLTFERETDGNFFFRYGVIDNDLVLNIGYTRKIDGTEAFYNEKKLNCVYNNNSLVISIPAEDVSDGNLIQIVLRFDEKEEIIKCWYTDETLINFNREKTSEIALYSASLYNDDSEEYIDDVRTIITAMTLNHDEALKEQLLKEKIRGNRRADEDSDFDDGEGIISYLIPDASEIEQYHKYDYIDKHFKIPCFKLFNEKYINHCRNKTSAKSAFVGARKTPQEREPNSSELRFKRFVKSRVKDMLDPRFVECISLEHYIFCVSTILGIFDKYSLKDNVKDMFEHEYLVSIRTQFLEVLISKDMPEDTPEEIKNTFLGLICQMMLESNKQVADKYTVEYKNKEILKNLDLRFQFRENMYEYICAAIDTINEYACLYSGYQEAYDFIDKSFGYATNTELEKIIRADYGETTRILFDENKISIFSQTTDIKHYFIPKERTIQELKKAYTNNAAGRYLKIEIENIANVPENSNYVNIVRDEIDLFKSSCVQRIIRKNGKEDKPTRTRL